MIGVPTEAEIAARAGDLGPDDKEMFSRVRTLLADHLGSEAAARLWLITPGTGFKTTAVDAVREGQVSLVLATLESQWGRSPTYA
jgi:hypothetical protein